MLLSLLADTVVKVPDPDKVTPGFAGFLTMFLLAVATFLLIRSMVKHLRKVRYSADPREEFAPPSAPTTRQGGPGPR